MSCMNVTAEQSVITLMLGEPECCITALAELDPEDFSDARNRKVFEVAQRLTKAGKPVDLVSVTGAISNSMTYLVEIGIQSTPMRSLIGHYIDALKGARKQRDTIAACKKAVKEAESNEDGYFERLQQAITAAGDRASVTITTVGDEAVEAVLAIGQKESTLSTGFAILDATLIGIRKTDLVVLAARPSVGKTALALNIAMNVCKQGKVAAVFSLEMDRKTLLKRSAFSLSRSSEYDILRGDENATQRLLSAADHIAGMRLYVDDRGGITAEQIRAACVGIKMREKQLDIVVVDYLQLMATKGRKNGTREQEVAEMSRAMKRLAMELKCPVLLLSQLSRNLEARDNKKPRLSDLRESGAIEQDADIVLFLHRPAVFDPHADPREANAIIAKNRNGACREVDLRWFGEWFLFMGDPEQEAEEASEEGWYDG